MFIHLRYSKEKMERLECDMEIRLAVAKDKKKILEYDCHITFCWRCLQNPVEGHRLPLR